MKTADSWYSRRSNLSAETIIQSDHETRRYSSIRAVCVGSQSCTWPRLYMCIWNMIEKHGMTKLILESWTLHAQEKNFSLSQLRINSGQLKQTEFGLRVSSRSHSRGLHIFFNLNRWKRWNCRPFHGDDDRGRWNSSSMLRELSRDIFRSFFVLSGLSVSLQCDEIEYDPCSAWHQIAIPNGVLDADIWVTCSWGNPGRSKHYYKFLKVVSGLKEAHLQWPKDLCFDLRPLRL